MCLSLARKKHMEYHETACYTQDTQDTTIPIRTYKRIYIYIHVQTDRQKDRPTDRPTDKQTDREI